MYIYLPIAELAENIFLLLAVGGGVGFLSGLFGVGGGFLLTPLLIFLGIPAPVAVASGANQVLGASVSGVLVHWRRGNVDVKMGGVLLIGALSGSTVGVWLFGVLREYGQVDLVVALSYVILLGTIGSLMLIEGLRTLFKARKGMPRVQDRGPHRHTWMHGLPLKMRFYRSHLYISAILPVAVGLVGGILSAIMGVGGGFLMVPLMIYLIGMRTAVVVGTSLFMIIFVTANVTFLQAQRFQTVDIVLTLLLLVGGVVGAQLGARLAPRISADRLRMMLAIMVLAVGARMLWDLTVAPDDTYYIDPATL
ncbi:MAG: TSUP family transporter [Alphaproteobacteria bacterium]|nr:TSUP family transporter [Alphaproteobacteria bacterium]